MALVANRRPVMTLYTGAQDPASHRIRIVLAEKNITADIIEVASTDKLPEDLIELNPYSTLPTLVDRDLTLYNAQIIMEYLDERCPYPPLMPVDPVGRARSRLYLYQIERDWYRAFNTLEHESGATADEARTLIRDSFTAIVPVFEQKPFFMSDEFTLVDSSILPLLWRLNYYNVELPAMAKPILSYAERLFERDSFQTSLSEREREMRQ